MKVKMTELGKKLGKSYEEMVALRDEKLVSGEWRGTGRNTWLLPEAAEKLELACKLPPAVPQILRAVVLYDAPNPNWVYGIIDGVEAKQPIAIPRRLHGKLAGKRIEAHAITDATGTTYRHASLYGHNY